MAVNEDVTEEEQPDDQLAPEVPTSFAMKGVGGSGRGAEGPDVVDLNDPADE